MAIASQCGFEGGASLNTGAVTEIPLSYVKNKTCEQILSSLSALLGGFWAARVQVNGDTLALKQWGIYDGVVTANSSEKPVPLSEKGPISRIIAVDTVESKTYDTMGSGDFSETLKTSADYMTMEQANSILSAYKDKTLYGWRIKADIAQSQAVELANAFKYGDGVNERFYPIGSYTLIPYTGGLGAELGAPEYCEAEWDFFGETGNTLAKKLTASTRYGTVSIDADGIKVHGRYD